MSKSLRAGWLRRLLTVPVRTTRRRLLDLTPLEPREVPAFLGGVNVAYGDVNGDGYADIVCGMASQGCQVVVVNGKDGTKLAAFNAYESTFTGGVYVAVGDVDGDGKGEIITGTGNGGGPNVRVYDGLGNPISSFFPYESTFRGGVIVAAGDTNGDGKAEIITGTGVTGGPRVQVINAATGKPLANFFAYESSFRGGVIVAAGDYNGDGKADVYTGTGVTGGPRVQVFDSTTQATLVNFFAYESSFRGGVIVGAGDANGDRKADVYCGTGFGGAPRTQVFDAASKAPLANFFAYGDSFRGGVNVTGGDVTGDGDAEIFTGPGPGEPPTVNIFTPDGAQTLFSFSPFDPESFPGKPVTTLPVPNQLSLVLGTETLDAKLNVGTYVPIQVRIVNPTANAKVTFNYTVTPNTGLTVTSDEPSGGWTTSTKKTFTVNQIYKGTVAGSYKVHVVTAIEGTGITVARDLTINVGTGTTSTPALTPPTTYPMSMAPATTGPVLFTAVLTGAAVPPTNVTLQQVDGGGTVLATVGQMKDDGVAPDDIAGDYVFTGSFSVTSGAADTQQLFRTQATIGTTTVTSKTAAILSTTAPADFAPADPGTAVTDPATGHMMIPNVIVVQFVPGTTKAEIDAVATAENGTLIGAMPGLGVYQYSIPGPATAATVLAAVTQWETHPEVIDASPDGVVAKSTVESDSGAYWYNNVRANEARVASTGQYVKVAVIDSGVDYNHPDLAGLVTKGPNYGTLNPFNDDPMDADGHGTHVAGLVAAARDGTGITGISGAKILAIKVFYNNGLSTLTGISRGIFYATTHGAKVINMSLGGPIPGPAEKATISLAQTMGRLIVVAAGNDSSDSLGWPASYAGVLAVGATDVGNNRSSFSNYGSLVGITAPGSSIYSTVPTSVNSSGFDTYNGTSMACPIVAGAAALVWGSDRTLTPDQVKERLIKTAVPFPAGSAEAAFFPNAGRLDVFEAVFNGSFEHGLTGWTSTGNTATYTSFGSEQPRDRQKLAYLTTGPAGDGVAASLERTFLAGVGTTQVTINVWYKFITEEFPEYVGTKFNDNLIIELDGIDGGPIANESVNSSQFQLYPEFNFPGGDSTAGATNWRRKQVTFTVLSETTYTLRIKIADAGDDVFDSVALIDRIRFVGGA